MGLAEATEDAFGATSDGWGAVDTLDTAMVSRCVGCVCVRLGGLRGRDVGERREGDDAGVKGQCKGVGVLPRFSCTDSQTHAPTALSPKFLLSTSLSLTHYFPPFPRFDPASPIPTCSPQVRTPAELSPTSLSLATAPVPSFPPSPSPAPSSQLRTCFSHVNVLPTDFQPYGGGTLLSPVFSPCHLPQPFPHLTTSSALHAPAAPTPMSVPRIPFPMVAAHCSPMHYPSPFLPSHLPQPFPRLLTSSALPIFKRCTDVWPMNYRPWSMGALFTWSLLTVLGQCADSWEALVVKMGGVAGCPEGGVLAQAQAEGKADEGRADTLHHRSFLPPPSPSLTFCPTYFIRFPRRTHLFVLCSSASLLISSLPCLSNPSPLLFSHPLFSPCSPPPASRPFPLPLPSASPPEHHGQRGRAPAVPVAPHAAAGHLQGHLADSRSCGIAPGHSNGTVSL
ncbi:unnamed protein product [Closterium sp. Naga37s-1]|nr:unnamed protein product [Closterium sp. Naga37s-1]